MNIGGREVPMTGGWQRMFTLGVIEVKVIKEGPAPAYTMWMKGEQQFHIRITQEVIDTWSTEAIEFLMRHEIGHVVLGHFNFDECKGPDAMIAADINVNYHLREDNDIIKEFGGVIAKDWLKELGLDYQAYPLPVLHEMLHQKMEQQGGGGSGEGNPDGSDMCGGVQGIGNEEDMTDASTAALAAKGQLSDAEQQEIGAQPGKGSANAAVHSLSENRPEWADKLAEWAQNVVELTIARNRTHKRPSWSYKAYGLHVPTNQPTWVYKPSTVVLLVDTSGSMIQLVQQIGPTIAFLNAHDIKVRLIAGDTRVLYDEETSSPPESLPGGGGTDIVPMFKHAIEQYTPEGIVCFTDGYVPYWPTDPGVPVLWIMDNIEAPFGEQVSAR